MVVKPKQNRRMGHPKGCFHADCQYRGWAGAQFDVEIDGSASPWRCGQAGCWCGFTDCILYIIAQGGALIDNAWNVASGE